MNLEQRKCFEEMAKLDTERFNREMAHYIPPVGMKRGRRRRRIKDPSMPKRSWSAFFFFCDAFRSKIRSEHPDWKVSDIAKELGRRWEECSDKEKYERRAQNDKLRYEQVSYKSGVSGYLFTHVLKSLLIYLNQSNNKHSGVNQP